MPTLTVPHDDLLTRSHERRRLFEALDDCRATLWRTLAPEGAEDRFRQLGRLRELVSALEKRFSTVLDFKSVEGELVRLTEQHPELIHAVSRLSLETTSVREALVQLIQRLEIPTEHRESEYRSLLAAIRRVLERMAALERREIWILQDAANQDDGGEGED